MSKTEAAELARTCRVQAQLASTSEVRKALIELAERYEAEQRPASVDALGEGTGERLK